MTLSQIRATYPHLFYDQQWWRNEAFAARDAIGLPDLLVWSEDVEPRLCASASDLAAKYVSDPGASLWRHFLWTDDYDRYGRRVYVGGIGHEGIGQFQVHRYLPHQPMYVRAA